MSGSDQGSATTSWSREVGRERPSAQACVPGVPRRRRRRARAGSTATPICGRRPRARRRELVAAGRPAGSARRARRRSAAPGRCRRCRRRRRADHRDQDRDRGARDVVVGGARAGTCAARPTRVATVERLDRRGRAAPTCPAAVEQADVAPRAPSSSTATLAPGSERPGDGRRWRPRGTCGSARQVPADVQASRSARVLMRNRLSRRAALGLLDRPRCAVVAQGGPRRCRSSPGRRTLGETSVICDGDRAGRVGRLGSARGRRRDGTRARRRRRGPGPRRAPGAARARAHASPTSTTSAASASRRSFG